MDTQRSYDKNFKLKKSQLFIKFPFVCLNKLKFIEHIKFFICNVPCAEIWTLLSRATAPPA
jgi:hypothetical protein